MENIIIDLRNNYGGSPEYASKYLFPYLYSDNYMHTLNWNVPISENNKAVNNLFLNNLKLKKDSDNDNFYYEKNIQYAGNADKNKKDIYYLIGSNTASAADGYISFIKDNDLGTIIGTNTSGEGLGGSFCSYSLPNSNLVFIYMPCNSLNKDGSNNSIYGTSPDIYIKQSESSFSLQRQMQNENIDTSLYSEKTKYDNVLNSTIEIINKK